MHRSIGAGALLALLASSPPLLAQTPPVPGTALPGRIERQFEVPPVPRALPPAPEPTVPAEPGAPGGGPQFVLREVVVEGSTIYTQEQLREEYAKYIDQTIGVDTIAAIEEAITRRYRRDGYILSRALVPADQTIDPAKGVIRILVLEGYIDKVRLDPLDYEVGERGKLVRSVLRKVERACRFGDSSVDGKPCPLHRDVLERYLLLANDLPGVKASAVIQPSTDQSGAADLFVTVNEKRYSAFSRVDNRGTVYNGPFRGDAGGSLNNLTDFYERTSARVIAAKPLDELLLVDLNEDIPLDAEGTRLTIGYSRSQSRPGDILRSRDIKAKTQSGTIDIAHPVLRTRSENLLMHLNFSYRNSTTEIQEAPFFDDRTRAVALGATYDLADRFLGVNLVDLRYTQGLPILDATREYQLSSRQSLGASGEFSKINLEASRLQQVYPDINVLAAVIGQYSFSTLLVSEEFALGGDRYVRAYDPSEVLGDHGVAGKLELQYSPSWARNAPNELLGALSLPNNLLSGVQFYAYYDLGMVWQRPHDAALVAIGGTQKDRDSAAAVGGGIRFNISDWLTGYFEVTQPLTRPIQARVAKGEDGKVTRYFFSLATQF